VGENRAASRNRCSRGMPQSWVDPPTNLTPGRWREQVFALLVQQATHEASLDEMRAVFEHTLAREADAHGALRNEHQTLVQAHAAQEQETGELREAHEALRRECQQLMATHDKDVSIQAALSESATQEHGKLKDALSVLETQHQLAQTQAREASESLARVKLEAAQRVQVC
jgi:hypothetical protein